MFTLPVLGKYVAGSLIPSLLPTVLNAYIKPEEVASIDNDPAHFIRLRQSVGKLPHNQLALFENKHFDHFANSNRPYRLNLLAKSVRDSVVVSPDTLMINSDCDGGCCVAMAVTPRGERRIFYEIGRSHQSSEPHDARPYKEKCGVCRVNCANGYFECMHAGFCIPCLFRLHVCPTCHTKRMMVNRISLCRTDDFKKSASVLQPCGHLDYLPTIHLSDNSTFETRVCTRCCASVEARHHLTVR